MKTTACSDVADYVWLTGDEAGGMLSELADDEKPLHSLVAKLRGRVTAERTHLLLEQVELRRRATAKFAHPEQMFFTRVGLEQATDEWVAAHKAARFASQRAGLLGTRRGEPSLAPPDIADLCCGIGGDLAALAKQCPVVGVDRDPMTAHFAALNSGSMVYPIDANQIDLRDISALHIDPDRRPTGRRTTSLESAEPNLSAIDSFIAQVPDAAVKLAPATRVPDHWSKRCELEWISRDRECRQLVAWHGELSKTPGQRRATVISTAGGLAPRTIVGVPNLPFSIVDQADRYVFDVDAAVLAARLKGVLAAEHALSALSNGPTYLTGPNAIDDGALTCFEVTDVLPFETRRLAGYFAEHSIGRLEIKKRGIEIDPEMLRGELKLRGDNEAALLITRTRRRSIAIIARR